MEDYKKELAKQPSSQNSNDGMELKSCEKLTEELIGIYGLIQDNISIKHRIEHVSRKLFGRDVGVYPEDPEKHENICKDDNLYYLIRRCKEELRSNNMEMYELLDYIESRL